MSQFIHHALMLLEDAGMSVRYPVIDRITREADGTSTRVRDLSALHGRRVSIEQNPQMKFMMMFALLDAHVDATAPALEGLSYRQKYQRMPAGDDAAMMLRELFRLGKLIRNTLVHHPSAFRIETGSLRITYVHNNTAFALTMSDIGLRHFYTALQMILRGDLGTGNYFEGIIRSLYAEVVHGIQAYSDEFGTALIAPPPGLRIQPHTRQLHLDPQHECRDGRVFFAAAAEPRPTWESIDFYVARADRQYLVPVEVLDSVHSIAEVALLRDWEHAARFPGLPQLHAS
jgi:hypothetical protein